MGFQLYNTRQKIKRQNYDLCKQSNTVNRQVELFSSLAKDVLIISHSAS